MGRTQFFYFAIELWGAFFGALAAIIVAITRKYDRAASRKLIIVLICSVFYLLSDSLAWFSRGDTSPLGFNLLKTMYFANIFFGFITISAMGSYFAYIIYRGTGKKQLVYKVLTYILMAFGEVFLIASRFFNWIYSVDDGNNIRVEAFNDVPTFICLAFMLVTMAVFLKCFGYLRRLESFTIITLAVILITIMLLQVLDFGIPFIDLSFIIAILILVVSYEQQYTGYMIDRQKRYNEAKIILFNRQIKPHFIFNSLSTIRALCRNSPEGVEAINDFSCFLRESIEILNNDECIPAEREFITVKHYMNLITKRYEGISVEYNLGSEAFVLPPFSVQTLAENSVRHGIRRREDCRGHITINSYCDGGNYIVEIIDDGVGFNLSEQSDGDGTQIGINNTRERLSLMCSGKLEIESVVGKGTTARIIIPAADQAPILEREKG